MQKRKQHFSFEFQELVKMSKEDSFRILTSCFSRDFVDDERERRCYVIYFYSLYFFIATIG